METNLDIVVPPVKEANKKRKKSTVKKDENENESTTSSAMSVINEIFNPSLKIPETIGHYTVPEEVHAGDVDPMKNLDERKLVELKEVFALFDSDCDGFISKEDLRITLQAVGTDADEEMIKQMLEEAVTPLDYDAFVALMSCRTVELDPEDVLLEAWSKWDLDGSGLIAERKIYDELTNYGERMSTSEAKEALANAPLAKPKALDDPAMIDYPAFCRMLSGLRKRVQEGQTA